MPVSPRACRPSRDLREVCPASLRPSGEDLPPARNQARLLVLPPAARLGCRTDSMGWPMSTLALVLADLAAEGEELDARLATLPANGWAIPTAAAGWTIAHQVAHLNWTDRLALLAICQPARLAEAMHRATEDPA